MMQKTGAKKLFTYVILPTLILLLLPFVYAESEFKWDTFPAGDVELYVTCNIKQDMLCNASVTCNISELISPDGSVILSDVIMTRKYDGYFNYTENIASTGDYIQKSTCSNDVKIATNIKKIRVVSTLLKDLLSDINISVGNLTKDQIADAIWQYQLGSNKSANETITNIYTSTKGIPDIALILSTLGVSGVFFFVGLRINGRKKKKVTSEGEIIETGEDYNPLNFLFFIGGFLGLLLSLNIAKAIAVSNNASSNILTMLNTGYVISIWIFFVSIVIFIILTILKFINDVRYRKYLEDEGYDDED